jgi:hypothetical protein
LLIVAVVAAVIVVAVASLSASRQQRHYYPGEEPRRARMLSDINAIEAHAVRSLPRYTRTGVKVLTLHADIRRDLDHFAAASIPGRRGRREKIPVGFVWRDPGSTARDDLLLIDPLPKSIEEKLRAFLTDEIGKWTGERNIEHTATYGVRKYGNGAVLKVHTDRPLTHALSAIVHVGSSEQTEDWPLHVYTHGSGDPQTVYMAPGKNDCVLYESATVPHGRPVSYKGSSYANVFLHWRPRGWEGMARRVMSKA